MLYKLTNSKDIAVLISNGMFRFYELTKYTRIEDEAGRFDSNEGAVMFTPNECVQNPELLPDASFKGIPFKLAGSKSDPDYLKQYFVFCMSHSADPSAIADSTHVVELYEDVFTFLEMVLNGHFNIENHKFFSHGSVEYYDINNHPSPFGKNVWKEVYLKRSEYSFQSEYRACVFAPDYFFEELKNLPIVLSQRVYLDPNKSKVDLVLRLAAGTDADGWRFIEATTSDFNIKLGHQAFYMNEIADKSERKANSK
jgi:hypothetical protein